MKKVFIGALLLFNVCNAMDNETGWRVVRAVAAMQRRQSVAFDRHGSVLYSVSEKPSADKPLSEEVQIFNTATGDLVCAFKHERVSQVAFNPDDENCLALSTPKTVALWDIHKKACVMEFSIRTDPSNVGLDALAFDPFGGLIVAGCVARDKSLFLFDPRIKKCVKQTPTLSQIYGVTFLGNGNVQSIGSDVSAH
jgi:WD40 repeat protein